MLKNGRNNRVSFERNAGIELSGNPDSICGVGRRAGFARVLFEISDKLCQLELAIHERDLQFAKLAANKLRVQTHVAEDILCAIEHKNLDVLPVICHRMACLGEASLFQLAELPRVLADQ